ncbi:MAG: P-II family nitrogen regulator [Oscillospiraceae bacterium]
MKKIEAIVRPEKLEVLKDKLLQAKVNGITISQVFGCGNQHGWTEYVRGSEVILNTRSKVQFTIVLPDDRAEEIISIIVDATKTGEVGDGKIFVTDIADAIRIRTGDRGNDAL